VTPETLPSFIVLIVRDIARGETYDEETCEPVKADASRMVGRLHYLIALSKKHGGEAAKEFTEEALEKLYKEFKLPGIKEVKLAGYPGRLDEVAREVEGLLGVKVVKEYHEEASGKAHAKSSGKKRRAQAVVA
jgi:LDH2 family malate/lactate/ureidoglycolate dehydrogenase